MSHFTVMAIGNDPAKLLAPFHEFECTGLNDQFVQDVDITAEVQAEIEEAEGTSDEKLTYALECNRLDESVVLSDDAIDREDQHKFGYAIVNDGKLIKAVKRTNPDAKWDWWVLGGRWSNALLLKTGKFANFGKVEDIDFDAMNEKARNKALEFHDKLTSYATAHSAEWDKFSKGPVLTTLLSEIKNHNDKLEEGQELRDFHEEYWTEERRNFAKSLREAGLMSLFGNTIDDLLDASKMSREEYADKSMNPSWQTYAAVRYGEDGKPEWTSRGEMGWFGMSNDELTPDEWSKKMRDVIASLPGDTRISIIDCHI